MTGNEIRNQFLEYFKKQGHKIVRSSSLVPSDDPTLLFTNAGMVQFKRIFLGEEKREYVRAATSQKCVRAGGKHNDLDNVGYTARHHTFFEMLGNFSFGDYFKEKAIEFAWDLLINGYRLPKEKLWVSIYLDDDEAFDIWNKKIGVSEDFIARLGKKDNFWSMGDTGPCGPCSEILIDRGEEYGCKSPDCKVGCDCDRYLEIWNLVFMQFNKDESGKMTPLPRPSIDTGMGIERVASLVQHVATNYDTDLLKPVISVVEELSGKTYGNSFKDDVAMKVIADHSRASAYLIGDGIMPSNEGRGYVLRRIMRRAIRYGRNLGLSNQFLNKTAKVVIDIMREAYPELLQSETFITNVIKNEEARFSETLDNGLKLLNESVNELKAKGQSEIPGDIIFKLYDTFGFPVDIVSDVLRGEKISLDMEGFNKAMAHQREQSRSIAQFIEIGDAYKRLFAEGVKPEFIGYNALSCNAKVLMIVSKGKEVFEASEGDFVELVVDRSPFYGESGGQVGDKGIISGRDFKMTVNDTIKDPTGLIIHKCLITSGKVKKNDGVNLAVDKKIRDLIARNHTATHILHAALRKVLGEHVKQSGSLVADDRLRFDFTHFAQVDADMLNKIETMVNERIRDNVEVSMEEMEAEKAFQSGATALFEEKYGDKVRVVSLSDFSKEFCGGTHIKRTGEIGFFKIISESSVAAGIRRIEALTGEAAVSHVQRFLSILQETASMIKEKPESVAAKIEKILSDQKRLEKEVEKLKSAIAAKSADIASDEIKEINGIKVLVKKVSVEKPAMLRELADRFKDRVKSGIVVLGAISGSKVLLIAAVTSDLTGKYHAGEIIKIIALEVGGNGGGRADMAQAGGTQPENLDRALEKVYEILRIAS